MVERFDRIFDLIGDRVRHTHIPQEDLCQAFGRFSAGKYEQDVGPSMIDCLRLLRQSADPATDLMAFRELTDAIDGGLTRVRQAVPDGFPAHLVTAILGRMERKAGSLRHEA